MEIISIILIIISVAASAVFASRIPPMWTQFTGSMLLLVFAIYLQRKSLKRKILKERGEGEGYTLEAFDKFNSKLIEVLKNILEKGIDNTEETVEVLEKWSEKISIDMDYFRVNISEEIGIGKFTEIMASFAKAERKLNRSYSALIDGYKEASLKNISEALRLTEEARKVIKKYI
jgi:hypothetical protein